MKLSIGVLLAVAVTAGSLFATVGSASTKAKIVTVTMTDFHFKILPRTGLKHGVPITFKVVNKGAALHNFDLQKLKASKVIAAGKTTSITVTFKKAGTYKYTCDVPRHAELGMAGSLKIS